MTFNFYSVIVVDNLAKAVVAAGVRLAHLHLDMVKVVRLLIDSLRTREVIVVVFWWFMFERSIRSGK